MEVEPVRDSRLVDVIDSSLPAPINGVVMEVSAHSSRDWYGV